MFKNLRVSLASLMLTVLTVPNAASALEVLVFSKTAGFRHEEAIPIGNGMLRRLAAEHHWKISFVEDSSVFTPERLATTDCVVWNNVSGNVLDPTQRASFQAYLMRGGGFVGIHNAMHAEMDWPFYRETLGSTFQGHGAGKDQFQACKVVVEDQEHPITKHFPASFVRTDEWYNFEPNPRPFVTKVLMRLEESTLRGPNMGGDHPVAWTNESDGKRVFYTAFGHTAATFHEPHVIQMFHQAILWSASTKQQPASDVLQDQANGKPSGVVQEHLLLDLDADRGVLTEEEQVVASWTNQVSGSAVKDFVKQDQGRKIPGSGRPMLRKNVAAIGGRNALVFKRQELVNDDDDAFDHLITGTGYTWFCVMSVAEQVGTLKDVNSFFGNLRNGGNYEGFWGGFADDNRFWVGVRNGIEGPRWTKNTPLIITESPLEKDRFYVLAGRMSAGQGTATVDLFINNSKPAASGICPVNPEANSQRMAVGQERDAIEHPGVESFDGEIARLLIYERPFDEKEIHQMMGFLKQLYQID